ncbi:MAG: cytochrome c family protein [Rhodospirillaceae bacterium]|jgi:cytochrome c|nr:cytochrome c family protein [Rhodospirillaceae bacterium]MBT4219740.1 cytochrome c family protein [Rhodospirillaceae bacterium]MBT4464368.1 cytochrome c family protein [Rhodospirillaceae bacterium]MBT5013181.1 cytochrome c family protein [Rhodospirillaceae bacterium]MBT5307765.1 cytochrome c family protein [Rhodospirillaceae bacterium]
MNAGFFENLLLSAGLTFAILAASHLAGEMLVQPIGEPGPAMTASAPNADKTAAPTAGSAETVPLATLLAAADLSAGKKLYSKCKACHTIEAGGKNRVGPNLWNVVGRTKAASEGFKYSGPMKGLGGEWSYTDLDAFLASPKKFVKGTKMSFAGLRKPADRAAMILYLRELSDSPVALP